MSGLHHVTAISGNAARNLAFYTHILGLRFVKKTVNFDDPGTYHLYYGDEAGRPGTILTFFPWEHAAAGRPGAGFTQETAFRVPAESLGYWSHRFIEKGVTHDPLEQRFGEPVLPFTDPDGMRLALVGIADAENEPGWSDGTISAEHALRGFHGVTLMVDDGARTGAILTVLGFALSEREESLLRFRADETPGTFVDIRTAKASPGGRMGRGSVHHIAFRAANDATQVAMARELVREHGITATGQKDRKYFRSVYFREPGGVLFEIATDQPGFTVDEPLASLGQELKLPPFLEPRRGELVTVLPPLERRLNT